MALTTTRSNLKDYAIRSVHAGATGTVAVDRVQNGIENALRLLLASYGWRFLQDTTDIVTIAPYTTGTVSVTNGTTSVTGSGTTFPSNSVGQFIEFDGQKHWYEVTVRSSATALTLKDAYTDPDGGNLSGAAYKILYVYYDLPGNFGRLRSVREVFSDQPLDEGDYNDLMNLHAGQAGTGEPDAYCIKAKRHDPNVEQLMLYPAPAEAKVYQVVYFRHPGWFDTATPATSTWKRKATADTDYVDWPEKYMDVLYAAVNACVAEEIMPEKHGFYDGVFRMKLAAVANQDRISGKPPLLGRPAIRRDGTTWEFT